MRYSLVLFFLLLALSTIGQFEFEGKLNAIISESQDQLSMYGIDDQIESFDCPPKLMKAADDSLLSFLHDLLINNDIEKAFFLEKMMQDNCRPYYNARILDEHYRPIYSKLLKEYSNSAFYEMLPIALSASNPALQIEGDRAGMWQLSYVNARRFGLQIDELIDERYDVTRSTYAAIQYFMFLEQRYPDRPLLVISAFYTSVPYVNKRLSKLEDKSDEAFLRTIDADLRNFLIYLVTWNEWINNFKEHKKSDLLAKAKKNWKNVEVRDTVEIAVLAEFLGLDAALLHHMNPVWIGNEITENTDLHPFYLPGDKADFVNAHYDGFLKFQKDKEDKEKEELLALKKRLANNVPDPSKYMALNYKVKSGDVLGRIAQRYKVKVSDIKKWNKLSSDRIDIGQELVLYVPKGKEIEEPEEKDDNKIEIVNTEPKPGKGAYTSYTVKDGESLWLIARKFPGVSSENIMEWNGISDKIKPGQVLKIYKVD